MRLDHLLSKEHYFLPIVVGVLVECTCVVLPTIFFNRVETHLKQEQLIVIYTVWFLKKYLVHCWVSGALFPGCVTRMSFDDFFPFVVWLLSCVGCCVRTV